MLKNQSMTISGLAVTILSIIVNPGEAETVVNAVVTIVDQALLIAGIVMTYWGRYRIGDIDLLGRK